MEISFGSCASRTIAGVTNAWQIMHGADRVLLVQSDLDNDIKVHYLVIPVRFMKPFLFVHLYLTTKMLLKVSQHSVSIRLM